MKYVRKISCNELLYADMQEVFHAYASQYVMKIKKLKSKEALERAINEAIQFNSGTNVLLKGKSFYDAEKPIELKSIKITGNDFWNSSFFEEKINLNNNSILAYLVTYRKDKYFVLKISHTAMDGKGGLLFINNIFRHLNGEPMEHYDNLLTDRQLVKSLPHCSKIEPKMPKLQPKNSRHIKSYTQARRIICFKGYTNSLVAKISKVFAEEFKDNSVKIMVPTDLRRHDRANKHCGNLVLPIMLRINKTDNIPTINGRLLMGLKNRDELNIKNTSYFCYQYLPKRIRHLVMRTTVSYAEKRRRFSIAGVVTYLGKIPIEKMQNDIIQISDFISIPPAEPLGPFIASIVEYSNETRIALCYYKGQYAEKYIDRLCEKLKEIGNEK